MSGRKNFVKAYKTKNDQSLGSSFQTDPITLTTASRLGFNVEATGVTANTGTFAVQHRIHKDDNGFSAWATLTLSATPTLADADATMLIDVSVPPGQVRLAFTQNAFETQTLTFPTKAGSTDGDYVVITDGSGTKWAIALDKTGAAAATPTGAAWVAVAGANKAYVDISSATTAAQVAALVETALDGLTGLSAAMTTDDSAANGTMLLTMLTAGNATDPAVHNFDDSGAGSITGVETSGPDGTCDIWVTAAQEG